MLKRIIPSSGELLPVVGLGTWKQFDVDLSVTDKEPLSEVLQLMAQQGGTLIDSSPMYGKSEEVIGALTKELSNRDDFFYATKVWTTGAKSGIQQMESSMRKMNRKTMDLIQVHNLMDYKTHLKTLRQWKEEGKIRYIGITHYTSSAHEELENIIKSEKIDFVQFNYSIRVRNAETRLLRIAKDKGIAVIINEPFEKGDLFRIIKDKQLPEWCTDYEIENWAQFFLKYIISHPAVNCVIPATSNPSHSTQNVKAGIGILPDEKGRLKMVQFIKDV